jgi:predicted transcriptional regulator
MDIPTYLRIRKLTQKEFSKILGISRAALTNYIAGRRRPCSKIALVIEQKTKGAITVRSLMSYADKNQKLS